MTVKLQVKFSGFIGTVMRFKPPKLITNWAQLATLKSQYLKHQWGGCRRKVQTLDHVAFRIIF